MKQICFSMKINGFQKLKYNNKKSSPRGPHAPGPPMGPIRSSSGAHGAPYLYPAGDPGPPTFTQKGPMGPLTVVFPPGKKFSRLCREKNFPLHGRVRGPMGPPTFTQ